MRWLASLTLLGAVLAGCKGTGPGGGDAGPMPECSTRAECGDAGRVCTSQGFCDDCTSSGECRVREQCDEMSRRCTFRPGWGEACQANEDCQAGSWCKQGLCVDRSQVSLCPGGMNAECPQGNRCNTRTTVCEEDLGCSSDEDCAATEACNLGSHVCAPRCTAETQADVCAGGEKCVKSLCVQCEKDGDCGPGLVCDAAGRCSSGTRCYTDRDCKVPLACFPQTGACLPKPPPCASDDNCPADKRCDVGSGKCIPRTCQPDRTEPNNSAAQAFATTGSASFTGLTLCPADSDWFAISLQRGDRLGVNVDADPFSESTFSTVVKDDSGRTLAAGKLLVSYVATAAQKYFVVVSTSDPYQPYDVTFLTSRGTPCDDDGHEPNDEAMNATKLNAATSLDGVVCPQDQDWFQLTVPTAKGLKASLVNYDSGKGLLKLCVFDGATLLGCDDATHPLVELGAAQVGDKTLLVRVDGSTERVSNGYTLQVEFP